MIINNIDDLAKHLSTKTEHLKHDVYKYTDCGAWIEWDNKKVSIGSIVEGSDAEYSYELAFPFDSDDYDDTLEELEEMVMIEWHIANCTAKGDF